MSELVVANLSKPSYLPATQAQDVTAAAVTGIGGAPRPHISLKGGRWRVVDGEGNETVLPTFSVDLAFVQINPNLSKTFYLKKYDPEGEATMPDCWSDDGKVPDPQAQAPQAKTCASCAHNVWGSDVNPMTGKKTRACKDSRMVSVALLANGKVSPLFGMRLSPTSFLALADFTRELAKAGHSLSYVVVETSFDEKSTFPKLNFKAKRAMSEDEFKRVEELRADDESKQLAGMMPWRAAQAAPVAAPVAAPAAVAPVVEAAPAAPVAPAPTTQQAKGDLSAPKEIEDLMSSLLG